MIRQNCGSCHGVSQVPMFAVSDATASHNTLINSGLVNLNSPATSRLVTKILGGHQTFTAALATQIQTAIQTWVDQLIAAGTGSGGGSPLPTPTPLTATYASIAEKILIPKCVSCHGATIAKSGFRYDTYTNTKKTVLAGAPLESKLYTSCKSGSMPEAAPNLTSEELAAIFDWITAGALQN